MLKHPHARVVTHFSYGAFCKHEDQPGAKTLPLQSRMDYFVIFMHSKKQEHPSSHIIYRPRHFWPAGSNRENPWKVNLQPNVVGAHGFLPWCPAKKKGTCWCHLGNVQGLNSCCKKTVGRNTWGVITLRIPAVPIRSTIKFSTRVYRAPHSLARTF